MAALAARGVLYSILGLACIATASRHAGRGGSAVAHSEQSRIVPKLDPKSHSHFFGHDYPHDNSPRAPLESDFSHPYPAVQDTDTYDKDYVKDENNDDGEWKAQQDYDRIRTRLENLKEDAKKILAKKRKLEQELEEERAKEKDVGEKKEKLKESERKADEEADDEKKKAEDRFKEATKHTESDSTDAAGLANASEAVRKEVKDLEDCKKQLVEAHEKLKALQEEMKEAEKKEKEATDARATAEEQEEGSERDEKNAKAELDEEQAKHESMLESYNKEKDDLAEMEKDLAAAEAKLRKFRGNVDQDGGVYYKKQKSGAPRFVSWLGQILSMISIWYVAL